MYRLMGAFFVMLALLLAACSLDETDNNSGGGESSGDRSTVTTVPDGESARVTRVIDGDTIDVDIDGQEFRVRFIGVNTPERDEPCYADATNANRDLLEGETVVLVRDESETDRFDRLLRYIYVDNTFVNAWLVENGYAEATRYAPDVRHFEFFSELERDAAAANLGCHPTGIFDDGTDVR